MSSRLYLECGTWCGRDYAMSAEDHGKTFVEGWFHEAVLRYRDWCVVHDEPWENMGDSCAKGWSLETDGRCRQGWVLLVGGLPEGSRGAETHADKVDLNVRVNEVRPTLDDEDGPCPYPHDDQEDEEDHASGGHSEQSEGGRETAPGVDKLLGSTSDGSTTYGDDTAFENVEWPDPREDKQ